MTGGLDVLNCGAGHLSIDFDKDKPEDVERAKAVIVDMLERGYTIVIETEDGKTHKVKDFDPNTGHYIVKEPPAKKPKKVPMHKARGTGIGQTAGG